MPHGLIQSNGECQFDQGYMSPFLFFERYAHDVSWVGFDPII